MDSLHKTPPSAAGGSAGLPAAIAKRLRTTAAILAVVGLAHFLLPEMLEPAWGVALLVLAGLNFVIRHPVMFLVDGAALALIGVVNIIGGLSSANGVWAVIGAVQAFGGVQEARVYSRVERMRLTRSP